MYSTCLVAPVSALKGEWDHVSEFDLEKQIKIGINRNIARTQKLDYAQSVTAELAALEVSDRLLSRSARRRSEHELADYIEDQVIPSHHDPKLKVMVAKLRACRCHATLATNAAGKVLTLWDFKCGLNRLCPDESRNETHRIIERFAPAVEAYLRLHPNARVYSAVLTVPNFPDGQLKNGLYDIQRRWNRLRKKKINKQLVFPEILGALTVVEAPRSSRGDWNVHMNALFIVDGFLDYNKFRRHWHWNLHINLVKGSVETVVKALKEIVKYNVLITPSKSAQHAEEGKTTAPAMTEWPASAWYEWHRAHIRYRRTRSYGKLFLNKARREELSLPEPETRSVDHSDLLILGRIGFSNGSYEVTLSDLSLIREDKSVLGTREYVEIEPSTHPPP